MTDMVITYAASAVAFTLFGVLLCMIFDDRADDARKLANDLEDETRRLYGHVEILQNKLSDIAAQETWGANATVRRMARMAREGMEK